MSIAKGEWYKWSCFGSAMLVAAVLGGPAYGQSAPSVRVDGVNVTGIPEDWSQRHVVYSNPGTEQDAIQAGRHAQWQQTVNNPRYVIQQLRKNSKVEGPASVDAEYRGRWASEVALGNGPFHSRKFTCSPA